MGTKARWWLYAGAVVATLAAIGVLIWLLLVSKEPEPRNPAEDEDEGGAPPPPSSNPADYKEGGTTPTPPAFGGQSGMIALPSRPMPT